MDFGAVSNIDHLTFALPPIDPRTTAALSSASNATEREFYLGCPVWNCREWEGSVYPIGASPRDYLRHYAAQFRAIELNATFYRTPDRRQLDRWIEQTPATFRFCPKIHQAITHGANPTEAESELARVSEMLRALKQAGRLGLPFLQLPPAFSPNQNGHLAELLNRLAPVSSLAIEFRHPNWFHQGRLIGRAFELLRRHGCATVITDTAGRRDAVHSTLTAPQVLIRFLGNALHPTDFERTDLWVERLQVWRDAGLECAYFFVHQPDNVRSPELANHLIDRLNKRLGLRLDPWRATGQLKFL